MKSMTIALDAGFGDVKICIDGEVRKEVSAIAEVQKDELLKDDNIITYRGKHYYVFAPATKLPNQKQVNITNFEELKFATPLFIKAIEAQVGKKVEKICLGLSLVMNSRGLEYKEWVSQECNIDIENVSLLPQGVGCKIAYSAYNLNPSDPSKYQDRLSNNYIGVDIGFNTIDVFQVIAGKLSTNATKGIENSGVVMISKQLQIAIKESHKLDIDISKTKEVLSTSELRIRGKSIDCTELISTLVKEYFLFILKSIESEFSESMDKMDNFILFGGGAALFTKYRNNAEVTNFVNSNYQGNFLIIPVSPEYYNVLGYYVHANK